MLIISDIRECTDGTHNCDHICVELEGGFECSCNDGYELENDFSTCSGKVRVVYLVKGKCNDNNILYKTFSVKDGAILTW